MRHLNQKCEVALLFMYGFHFILIPVTSRVRSEAFTVTKADEIFSRYQPCQSVDQSGDRRFRDRDSAIGIVSCYGLEDRGVGVRVSSPRRPDRLWGPPSFLSNGYRDLFPRG
jgi:hypothetical protein